jgi:hypothetical protein
MSTQKPLKEIMPDIIAHYNSYIDYIETNKRLYYIWQGQLREEVETSLRKEILSTSAFNRAIQRIPSINIIKKSVDKLSKVYIENPVRMADNETDREVMHQIAKFADLNNVMRVANEFYNLHGMFAIEPFIEEGVQSFRVLGGHQFLPYSDDPVNPMRPSVMIKILGNEQIINPANQFDDAGRKQSNEDDIRMVTVLALYSDDEFMIIDTGGNIRVDKMREQGVNSTKNPFKTIPFIYGNRSKTELVPFPNKEGLDMSILIPKLYTDLNYAAQFMSHSIIWFKNADLSNQEINPDAMVDLGERTEENGDPEIGTIEPTVDIPNILSMISNQLDMYFASIGIKTSTSASMGNGQEASGVAKSIEEGDTTSERKRQLEFFSNLEMKMWNLISAMESVWAASGILTKERRKFSEQFVESFRIIYAEMKPLKTFKQKIEEIQLLRDQKLISKKQSIRVLYPDMTDKQVDDWLTELTDEGEEELEAMMMGAPMAGPERTAAGTFNEGNQASAEQNPDKRQEAEEKKKA